MGKNVVAPFLSPFSLVFGHGVCKIKGFYDFTKKLLGDYGRTSIWGETVSLSPVSLSILDYSDMVTVYIAEEQVIIPRGMIRIDLGQVVRLEFHHKVEYHTDSCLGCRCMIT